MEVKCHYYKFLTSVFYNTMSGACSTKSKPSFLSKLQNSCTDTTGHPNKTKVLKSVKNNTIYNIVEEKGCKRYRAEAYLDSKTYIKGSEIIVSKLPVDLTADDFIPVFEKAGNIREVELVMESANINKGYTYIQYQSPGAAEKAIDMFNGYEIRPKRCLSVSKGEDNNRLFVGGIPKDRQQKDVYEEMKKLTEGVINVILYPSVNDRSKNRGYAFVEYSSNRLASNARTKLINNRPLLWGVHEVKVDWAEPEYDVDAETMSKVKILYVRNLAALTTEAELKELFSSLNGVVERVKKQKDYAFIHFATREQAIEAKEKFHETTLDGCVIEVTWSKPVKNREEYQQRKVLQRSSNSAATHPYSIAASRDQFKMVPWKAAMSSQAFNHQARALAVRPKLEPGTALLPLTPNNLVLAQNPYNYIKPTDIMPEYNYSPSPQCDIYSSTPTLSDKVDRAPSTDLVSQTSEIDFAQYGVHNLQTPVMHNPMYVHPQSYIMASPPVMPPMFTSPQHMAPTTMFIAQTNNLSGHTPFPSYINPMNAAAYYHGPPVAQVPAITSPTLD